MYDCHWLLLFCKSFSSFLLTLLERFLSSFCSVFLSADSDWLLVSGDTGTGPVGVCMFYVLSTTFRGNRLAIAYASIGSMVARFASWQLKRRHNQSEATASFVRN